ncbi:MAG TPA: hypothetical protein VKU39_07665 [Streptosporangiaceae bacterium]|nr:hypothetical protein [Streptosporangiaceae bacterium]
MPVLIAAVILVGVVCLTDLLLTFGVIRRLREHTAMLGETRGADPPVTGLAAGQTPDPFAAVTIDGAAIAGPAGLRVVAFFSRHCPACPGRISPFIDYVRANHLSQVDVLAVVTGSPDEPVAYLGQLADVAQVCVEEDDDDLAKAFKVSGFPAFCLLSASGAVFASGFDPAALPAPEPAAA